MARDRRPHRVFLARQLQQQRALDRVPAGAEGRDLPRRPRRSRTTAPTRKSNNFGPRVGFAWDLTGDGKTSLRGGGGMFYDQHRDGESGQRRGECGAVEHSAERDQTGGPVLGSVSRPHRFQPHHRRHDRHDSRRRSRRPVLIETLDSDVQDAAHLQLQPHVRARADAGADGARRLCRLAVGERTSRPCS